MEILGTILSAILNSAAFGKILGGLAATIGAFFLFRWINKKLKEAAHNKTQKGRLKDQAELDQENRDIFLDAQESEQDIEEIIKQRGKK